jgi:hypothetical protein
VDEKALREFMKREHQSEVATKRCVDAAYQWENFLQSTDISEKMASIENLEAFANHLNDEQKIKNIMQGLSHFFIYLENNLMSREASKIRNKYIKRKTLRLKEFIGVPQDHIMRLKDKGITDASKILALGVTENKRKELAKETGIPYGSILVLVKMADLSRIFGLKGVRTRLYVDSGIDTVEKISEMSPENLIDITKSFIERTSFTGIPPTPKEAKSTIEAAKILPKIIEY